MGWDSRLACLQLQYPPGGADTTNIALSSFIAAMLLYPAVQMRGQAEVDSCIRSRLPSFDDLRDMPYVQAIMLEVLRSVAFIFCK